MAADQGEFQFVVAPDESGLRLDAFVSRRLVQYSRSQTAMWIRNGHTLSDGLQRKPSYKVKPGEIVRGLFPQIVETDLIAEDIPINILYEDHAIIVVNKPAGLVVHPAAGHPSGTLVNGLLYHCPDIEGIGGEKRPGIVHRLDKDTSGVLVAAKNGQAHEHLARQFKERTLEKHYLALVAGSPEKTSGTVDLPVGRHPTERKKMSVSSPGGRNARTLWRVKERFGAAALLDIELKTGRTHQIRVHCRAMGHAIIGDPVYGPTKHFKQMANGKPELRTAIRAAKRQMLHAVRLRIQHPTQFNIMTFEAPVPEDMLSVLSALRQI